MSKTLNQYASRVAHIVGQPDNHSMKERIKEMIKDYFAKYIIQSIDKNGIQGYYKIPLLITLTPVEETAIVNELYNIWGHIENGRWIKGVNDSKYNTIPSNTNTHPRWNDSINPIIYGVDRFNFSAIPSGARNPSGEYNNLGFYSYLYTNNDNIDTSSTVFVLYNYTSILINYPTVKNFGYSIRLVRETTFNEDLLNDGTIISNAYTDYDGNIYSGTKIGSQVWTTSNLKTTHYTNGVLIPTNLSNENWNIDVDGACAVYNKSDLSFIPIDELTTEELMINAYGRLYNWYAINNSNKLIDINDGWSIPSYTEFNQLINYLITTYSDITTNNIGNILKNKRQVNSNLLPSVTHPLYKRYVDFVSTTKIPTPMNIKNDSPFTKVSIANTSKLFSYCSKVMFRMSYTLAPTRCSRLYTYDNNTITVKRIMNYDNIYSTEIIDEIEVEGIWENPEEVIGYYGISDNQDLELPFPNEMLNFIIAELLKVEFGILPKDIEVTKE